MTTLSGVVGSAFFYAMDYANDKRWRACRERSFRRNGYMCLECLRYGKHVPAVIGHHAYPAEEYPELRYQDWNIVPLCKGCHDLMHDRDTRALTETGRRWLRRVKPPSPSG